MANLASPNRANAKLIAEPIAVRPTKERGATLRAAAKARALAEFRMTVQSTTIICSLSPAHVRQRDCAVGARRDRVEQLLALDRLGVSAPLQGEFAVVDAARDVRRQNNRGVDLRRRIRRPHPPAGGRREHQNDGRNSEANPQTAHRSLHRPADEDYVPPRKTARGKDDRPLYTKLELRAITRRPASFDKPVMRSSTKPSQK